MVRLETRQALFKRTKYFLFTFQYGQIRNDDILSRAVNLIKIYIPVWLDQKLYITNIYSRLINNLHSSMVRLETYINNE